MKLRHFVSTSAVILAAWLGFTFVHEVPTQPYPKLDKYTARQPVPASTPLPAGDSRLEISQVSLSH